MLFTTTDTLPQKFEVIGMVSTTVIPAKVGLRRMSNVHANLLANAQAELADQADDLGANAVIGIRVASLGGGVDLMMGTAVKVRN